MSGAGGRLFRRFVSSLETRAGDHTACTRAPQALHPCRVRCMSTCALSSGDRWTAGTVTAHGQHLEVTLRCQQGP